MKNRTLPLLIFCLWIEVSFSQTPNNNYWVFGDSAAINWINPQSPQFFRSNVKSRCGTVSLYNDTFGLYLYANYNKVQSVNFGKLCIYNKYNSVLSNSDSVYGEDWYHSLLLLPQPGNDSISFLFSVGVVGIAPYGLHYSIINHKANNDSGIVVQKNIQLNNLPAFDGLTAVRHGNGRDWWLIFKRYIPPPSLIYNNDFYVYLLDSSGVSGPLIQSIGTLHIDNGGQLLFTKNGLKTLLVTFNGLIELYDFDRCTGNFSNFVNIQPYQWPGIIPWYSSCALSPDETKLYVSAFSQNSTITSVDSLFQFDLTAPDISASKTPIFWMPNRTIGMGSLRRAPDNKIYLGSSFENYYPYKDTSYNVYNTHLSVINQPDSLGFACDFQPFSFYLGGARTYYGLPNNPDYELGAWVGSPCDTLAVGITENDEKQQVFFQAWYNSEWNMIHVNASKLKGRKGSLRLFDMEGRLVFEKKVEVISGGYVTGEIPMNGVVNGVYLVNLITDSESVSSKTIKF